MPIRKTIVLVLSGILLAGACLAKPTIVSVDALRADERQRQTALIITQVMEKFHYRKPQVNDEMSAAVFDRYLESLDANRSFFSALDIAEFERYRHELDDSLRSGKLDPAFRIFRRFRELVEQRVAFAIEILNANEFDFERDETYDFDRSEAEWLPEPAAIDDLWRRRIKNDILSLRLSGKEESEIKQTLTKGRAGVMPAQKELLSEEKIHLLTAYVYSLSNN